MKFSHLLLFAAGVPFLAAAQANQATPPAADTNAPVPPLEYHSVFADYVVAKEPAHSPDKGWVAANRAVMGAEAVVATSDAPPPAGASDKPSDPKPMHDKHDHKGAHQ